MLLLISFQCILAAIIVVSLKKLFLQFSELRRLWKVSKLDFVSKRVFQ